MGSHIRYPCFFHRGPADECVQAQGIVTNATDVKPMITVATYLHDASGCEVYQEVTGEPATRGTLKHHDIYILFTSRGTHIEEKAAFSHTKVTWPA